MTRAQAVQSNDCLNRQGLSTSSKLMPPQVTIFSWSVKSRLQTNELRRTSSVSHPTSKRICRQSSSRRLTKRFTSTNSNYRYSLRIRRIKKRNWSTSIRTSRSAKIARGSLNAMQMRVLPNSTSRLRNAEIESQSRRRWTIRMNKSSRRRSTQVEE